MLCWISGCRSLSRYCQPDCVGKRDEPFVGLAARLRLVWEFPLLLLGVVGAEPTDSGVVLATLDTGCPGRTAGYLKIWEL